ncbi:MAG: hypothetical protein AB8G05_24255 [Oligoflexales bacterium]
MPFVGSAVISVYVGAIPMTFGIVIFILGNHYVVTAEKASGIICQNTGNFSIERLENEECSVFSDNQIDICSLIKLNTSISEEHQQHDCHLNTICNILDENSCINNFTANYHQFGTEPFNCIYSNPEDPCENIEYIDVNTYFGLGKSCKKIGLHLLLWPPGIGALGGLIDGAHRTITGTNLF